MEPIETLVILIAVCVGVYVVWPGLVGKIPIARTVHRLLQPLHGIMALGVGIFGVGALGLLVFTYGWWMLFPLSLIAASATLAALGFLFGRQVMSDRPSSDETESGEREKSVIVLPDSRLKPLGWASLILGILALFLYVVR